jgi:hypothetical protein|tara:strand:+ start:151 stop:393 length:243 start_codon:yes stop_codon:yes gene_type:complete
MRTDVDYLISLMKEFTFNGRDIDNSELGEQEETTSTGPGPGYPAVTKWETGLNRGPANQIGNTKWKDSVTLVRGKGNTLL